MDRVMNKMAAPATMFGKSARKCASTPPLKWAGGKRWLVPHLLPLWVPYRSRRLVEPFCGGLAVTLGFGPSRALLNDINPHLINFYRALKRGALADVCMMNDRDVYEQNRRSFNALISNGGRKSGEAAALFYYLNRTGFNGLCRFNSSGKFNVPFGRYATINYARDFTSFRTVTRRWTFLCEDFEKVSLLPDDFVYADPPYDVEFTRYAKEDFTWADQERLANWLCRHPGPVVLSNQATDRIVSLYENLGYKLAFLKAPRRISCTGDRTPVREILALRNL